MSSKFKFVVFGSCLSAHIATRLRKKGFEYLGALRHVRSDVFLNSLDNLGGFTLSESDIKDIIEKPGLDPVRKKKIEDILTQNSKESLNSFVDKVKKSDFVLFDNQYDLARSKFFVKYRNYDHVVSNLGVGALDLKSKNMGVLPDESFKLYGNLYQRILEINPDVRFLFVQYPILDGEDLSPDRKERVRRSVLTSSYRDLWSFLSTPLFKVSVDYASDKNINHFKPKVYDSLSNIVAGIVEKNQSPAGPKVKVLEGFERKVSSPYANLPDRQYWKPAVAEPYPLSINDLYRKKFDIGIEDAVATCGSCFAQHIGKRLDRKGYNYMDVEPIPEKLPTDKAKALGYGIYSARYGNVYTSRQLIQLFERAYGELDFDEVWKDKKGRYVDPFRPNLCGEGYSTADEVLHEQRQHLSNVRRMFETLDVFVFTMGVTETWINRQTGAVYPICPGVTAGTYDPDQHEFVNLDYATILEEMETFLSRLGSVNPNAKVLLTVSPVPLTATAEERHVLLSTMASKSILRAVADQLYRRHAHVDYFPSYDIIMSPPYKSMFFKNNLRSIHEEGVDYVMSHFFAQHRLENEIDSISDGLSALQKSAPPPDSEEDDEAFCDEAFLELERNNTNN
ncbi:GSCFA domain-containing protein [Halomonas sp. LS-001]